MSIDKMLFRNRNLGEEVMNYVTTQLIEGSYKPEDVDSFCHASAIQARNLEFEGQVLRNEDHRVVISYQDSEEEKGIAIGYDFSRNSVHGHDGRDIYFRALRHFQRLNPEIPHNENGEYGFILTKPKTERVFA